MSASGDSEQIRREIEDTREQLGDTVEAIARKTDVKARVRHGIEDAKTSIAETRDSLLDRAPDGSADVASQASRTVRENPITVAAAGAFAAGFLAVRISAR